MTSTADRPRQRARQIDLQGRSVALVGLMGAGKTTIGRKLAQMLEMPFVDSDAEIERVSRMSVSELFAAYGETEFRALEARVLGRIVEDRPRVIGTGGGAYMNEATRGLLRQKAVTVWLKADIDLLMERVGKRPTRPLLQAPDPRGVMQRLMEQRYPIYAEADITVQSRNARRETIAREIVTALDRWARSGGKA